jgi:hypothetical protein
MMREIKFRQPVFHNGDFIRFHYWGFIGDGSFVGAIPPLRKAQKDSQQFTNLRDSKGTEIYEGDIINMSEPQYHWSQNKAVYWLEDRFTIGQHAPLTGIRNYTHFEVIGNVYENPDLLKGE